MVAMVAALPPHFFELLAALVRLSAVLAVAVYRIVQLVLSLVDAPFTSFVSLIRSRLEGRTHQANHRQQGNAEHSNHSGHVFSFDRIVRFGATPASAVADAIILRLIRVERRCKSMWIGCAGPQTGWGR
jgi:hypothetical protein